MSTTTLERDPIAALDTERSALAKISTLLDEPLREAFLAGPGGVQIPIPASLFNVLERAVRGLMRGQAVAIVPIHQELTTQQAADLLDVSRQYFVRLLDRGEIPFTKTGTHRRVKFGDLMDYKRRRDVERRKGLRELTQLSEEIGLYGTDGA